MGWTIAEKIEAAIAAPIFRDLLRPDSQVIERPGWFQIVTPSSKGTILNEVIHSRVDPADAEATIERVVAQYRAHGLPVKWFVGPWTEPADFGARLERRGFSSWDVRAMACDTSMRLGASRARMERVTESNLDAYLDTFLRGWSVPADQRELTKAQMLATFDEPQRAHFFLATIDGAPAGTTGLILRGRYAYLVGAQVLDEFRGRGLYRALIEERLRFLRERDISLAVTLAREATSAPMLEHLGFETLFPCRCYLLAA